ncbi:hypothetical protein PLESTM_001821600 [Pleodorina starrii]|nr:hypothetical protein PLESTM_001821600 [Pleodorina starrii]
MASSAPFVYGVCLNPLDCNVDLILSDDRLSAQTLSVGGCGYCWSGVRANLGVFARGRYFFRVTLGSPRPVNVHNTKALSTAYGIRVGVSRFQTAVEQLGEVPSSWAYCSTGSRASFPVEAADGATGGGGGYPVFEQRFGPRLNVGDTLTIAIDLASSQPAEDGAAAAASEKAGAADGPTAAASPAATTAGGSGGGGGGGGDGAVGTLWMAVNGGELVPLFPLPLPTRPTESYFPHILLRNLSATADFLGEQAPEQPPHQQQPEQPVPQRHQPLPRGLLERGFRPWQEAPITTTECVSTLPMGPLPTPAQCEVVVLTGLPGSGKSTWAARHCASHPARRFCVLGPQLVLEQMRLICPRTRRFHYEGKPEEVFALVSDTLGRLVERAPATPRNYILDRTHVSRGARLAAVEPFRSAGFRCVGVAVVPTEAALFAQQKEAFEREGKVVPDDVMARLRADFTLPNAEEGFDDVQYPVLGLIQALAAVNRQRREAKAWLEWRRQCIQAEGQGGILQQQRQQQQGGEVKQEQGQGRSNAGNAAESAAAADMAAAAASPSAFRRDAAVPPPPHRLSGSGSIGVATAAPAAAPVPQPQAAPAAAGGGDVDMDDEGLLPPLPTESPPRLDGAGLEAQASRRQAVSGSIVLEPPLPSPTGPTGAIATHEQHHQSLPLQEQRQGELLPPQQSLLLPPQQSLPPQQQQQSPSSQAATESPLQLPPLMPSLMPPQQALPMPPLHPQQQQQHRLSFTNQQTFPMQHLHQGLQHQQQLPGPGQPLPQRFSGGGGGAEGLVDLMPPQQQMLQQPQQLHPQMAGQSQPLPHRFSGGGFPNFMPQQQQQQMLQQPHHQQQQQQQFVGQFGGPGGSGPSQDMGPLLPTAGSGRLGLTGSGPLGFMGSGPMGSMQAAMPGLMPGQNPGIATMGSGGGPQGMGSGFGGGMGMGMGMAAPDGGGMGMGMGMPGGGGNGMGMGMQGMGGMAGGGGPGMGMGGGGRSGMGMGMGGGGGPGMGMGGGGGPGMGMGGGGGPGMGMGGGGGPGMGMGGGGGPGMGMGMPGVGGMVGMGMQGGGGMGMGAPGGMAMGMQGPGGMNMRPPGMNAGAGRLHMMQQMQGFRPPGMGR